MPSVRTYSESLSRSLGMLLDTGVDNILTVMRDRGDHRVRLRGRTHVRE